MWLIKVNGWLAKVNFFAYIFKKEHKFKTFRSDKQTKQQ